ncbi:MAG: LacI family DNA-binding transcriptional regulator [Rhodobiaceae bacterium]|nr:LacI family DNA-binding transcriptional regulator [Rhodobiaceae bacterium]
MARRATQERRPSIHDVASHAGVSAATVSKVMQGVATVKPENVRRVFHAVETLGYRADPLASDLRRARRRIIGAVLPEFESEFFGSMVTELERLAELRGYTLVAASSRESQEREREIIQRMHDWRVAGVVLAPVRDETGPGAMLMTEHEMTGVLIDRVRAGDTFDSVAADGARASAEVAEALVEAGHRHVLVLGLGERAATIRTRFDGFRDAAMARAPDIRIDEIYCESDLEPLRTSVSAYFDRGERPTAVFSLFARGALVALSEFRRRGWHCPDDISLVSFDDAEWMQVAWPSIAAVVQPVARMAEEAMDILFDRIEGREGETVARLEPCTFQIRESVGPPAR